MDPLNECIGVIVLLTLVLLLFAWEMKKLQRYHLKRVLELLEEKHEVERQVSQLEKEKFDLGLELARRDDSLVRAATMNLQLSNQLNDLRLFNQRIDQIKNTLSQPEGPSRLNLISEDE